MKIEVKNFVQDWKIKLRKCFRKDIRKTRDRKERKIEKIIRRPVQEVLHAKKMSTTKKEQ